MQLHGIIPPLATPLLSDDRLDEEGLARLLDHVIDGGAAGVFVLGTTGETASLTLELRRAVVTQTCDHVVGRVPVLVGITDTVLAESIAMAKFAAEAGADGVVLTAPYYYPISQDELYEFTVRVAQTSPLPILLYNMPSHTKLAFDLKTVRKLFQHDNIIGMKDSSRDLVYHQTLLDLVAEERPGFTVLMGPEQLVAESVLLGGNGGVCAGSNIYPKLYVDLYDAAHTGDLNLVQKLHHRVLRLARRVYTVSEGPSAVIRGVKASLEELGICNGHLASPMQPMSHEERRALRQHLEDLELFKEVGTPARLKTV